MKKLLITITLLAIIMATFASIKVDVKSVKTDNEFVELSVGKEIVIHDMLDDDSGKPMLNILYTIIAIQLELAILC